MVMVTFCCCLFLVCFSRQFPCWGVAWGLDELVYSASYCVPQQSHSKDVGKCLTRFHFRQVSSLASLLSHWHPPSVIGGTNTQSCCLWVGYKITSPVDPIARLGYQLPIGSLIPEQMRSLSKVPHSLCSTTSLNNSSCVIIQHSTLIKQDKKIKRYKNLHKHSLNCTTILLVNCISFFDLYFYLFKGARSWLLQDLWTL